VAVNIVNSKLAVKDFGPFEYAELELKPLTIIIGGNSLGKSMLTYLLWSLMVTTPDFEALAQVIDEHKVENYAKSLLESVRERRVNSEALRKLFIMHVEALPQALASGFKRVLEKTFATPVGELVRKGAVKSIVHVEGKHGCFVEFEIENNNVKAAASKNNYDFINRFKIVSPRPGYVEVRDVKGEFKSESIPMVSLRDIVNLLISLLVNYVVNFYSPFFTVEEFVALLPDSRAGVSRFLLRPYPSPEALKNILYPDEHFARMYFMLSEKLAKKEVEITYAKPLLEELGYTPEVSYEAGAYAIYVKMWNNVRAPLVKAPSGIRESLTLTLALTSRKAPYIVVVEEPEAHLHPKAQRLLAELIAKAINNLGKTIIITTHSDYLVYSLSNIIAASSRKKIKETLIHKIEALNPAKVSAYLVKKQRSKAVLEELKVSDEGILEEEFAKIAEELAEERVKILG